MIFWADYDGARDGPSGLFVRHRSVRPPSVCSLYSRCVSRSVRSVHPSVVASIHLFVRRQSVDQIVVVSGSVRYVHPSSVASICPFVRGQSALQIGVVSVGLFYLFIRRSLHPSAC